MKIAATFWTTKNKSILSPPFKLMAIVSEQCCEQRGHASVPVLVSPGLAPSCKSGVGTQTTTAFQQKALIIYDDLV